MLVFASAFPVAPGRTVDDLLRVAQEWLAGSPHYPLGGLVPFPVPPDEITPYEHEGHRVWVATFSGDGRNLGGLRHQWCEDGCRDWTTEIVGVSRDDCLWVSVRLSCDLPTPGQRLPMARKPHVIKQVFDGLGGGQDGRFVVSDRPHVLRGEDVRIGAEVIEGRTRCWLPIIYVSADFEGHPFVDVFSIAKWFSGLAHVVVEPNRLFSMQLARAVNNQNPYGGAVAAFWPEGGGRSQRLLPRDFRDSKDLALDLQKRVRSAWLYAAPGPAATWADIKEAMYGHRIDKLKKQNANVDEYVAAFDGERAALRERLALADTQLVRLRSVNQGLQARMATGRHGPLLSGSEQELYPGEFADALVDSLHSERTRTSEGSRRRMILDDLIAANPTSGTPVAVERVVREALATAGKVSARELGQLRSIGFEIEDGGKHYKATFGGDARLTFTIPKTPSDHRAGRNLVSDIVKTLFKP